ncbi:MAG: hypothetical protein DWQ07_17650 [Chloroflexi bacterium]|nr:MAG: hypothetical protein DWQ07_17650 [Chloroflexota bacterium]
MAASDHQTLAQRGRQLLKLQSFLDQVQQAWPALALSRDQILTDATLMHLLQSVLLESGLSGYLHSRESTFTDAWESFLFAVERNKLDEVLELLLLTQYHTLSTLMLYPLRYHEEALAEWFYGNEPWGLLYEILAIEISDYGFYMCDEWDSIRFEAVHVLAGALQPLLAIDGGIDAVLQNEKTTHMPSLLTGLALRYGSAEEGDPFIGHMFVQDEEIDIGWDEIPDLLGYWRRWKRLEKQAPNESQFLTAAWLFSQACQCLHLFGENHD